MLPVSIVKIDFEVEAKTDHMVVIRFVVLNMNSSYYVVEEVIGIASTTEKEVVALEAHSVVAIV